MSVFPLSVWSILIAGRKRTLKNDQTRLEPRVGLLDLFDLGLQSSPDILGNSRAIDLGSHSASSAVGCTIDKILQWWWMGPEEQRGTTTMGPNPTRSNSDPLKLEERRAGGGRGRRRRRKGGGRRRGE